MRQSIYLTTVCGTALALAGTAFAQNTQNRQNENQVRQARTDARTDTTARDPASILRSLEGLWAVEVQINEALWNRHTGKSWTPEADHINRPVNPEDGTTPGRDGRGPTSRDNDNRVNPDANRLDADRTNRPATGENRIDNTARTNPNNLAGTRTINGAAETSLIMGGKILQERAFLSDSTNLSADRTTDRRSAVRIDPSSAMHTLSYIAFDESRGTYSAVFMSDQEGMMHFDSGRYEAGSNRIVFHGRADYASPSGRTGNDFREDNWNDPNPGAVRDSRDPSANRDTITDRDRPLTDRDRDNDNRPATDRSNPDRTNPDSTNRPATDRPATDRPATDRPDQDTTRPVEGDRDLDGPFWEEHNRRPNPATDPATRDTDRVNRPGSVDANRNNRDGDDVYVVVPENQQHQGMHGGEPVQVVLELLGNDQYRVTMYRGGSLEWSDRDMNDRLDRNRNTTDRDNLDRNNRDRDLTDRDNINDRDLNRENQVRDPANRDAADLNRRTTNPAGGVLASNVVYQATFTRASGADAQSYRQMFDNAERD